MLVQEGTGNVRLLKSSGLPALPKETKLMKPGLKTLISRTSFKFLMKQESGDKDKRGNGLRVLGLEKERDRRQVKREALIIT